MLSHTLLSDIEKLKSIAYRCNSHADLITFIGQEEYDQMIALRKKSNALNRFKITTAIRSAIILSSIPMNLLGMITSILVLGTIALWLAGGMILLSFLIANAVFLYKYQNRKRIEKNDTDFIELYLVKIEALNKLIEGEEKANAFQMVPEIKAESGRLAHQHAKIKKVTSFAIGLSISCILGFTFYWGISDVLFTLGVIGITSSLATPVGLIVASILALSIGIYLGVMHYKSRQNTDAIKQQKIDLEHEVIRKQSFYIGLMQNKKNQDNKYHEVKQKENSIEREKMTSDPSVLPYSLFKPRENLPSSMIQPRHALTRSCSFP